MTTPRKETQPTPDTAGPPGTHLESGREGIEVRLLWWTVSRWWPAVALAGVAAALLAYLVVGLAPDRYASQARVLVGTMQGPVDDLRASASLTTSYADVLASPAVHRAAADAAGLTATDDDLADAITVTGNERSRLLTVDVTWADPDSARRLTDALVAQARAQEPPQSPDLPLDEAGQRASGSLRVVQPASLAVEPVDTRAPLIAALAGLVAATATLVALLVWIARRRRRSQATRDALRDTLLAELALRRPSGGDLPEPSVLTHPDSRLAEQFEEVAARAEVRTATGLTALAVFGTRDVDHSTRVAFNLALTYATAGRSVTVIDTTGQSTLADAVAAAATVERGWATVGRGRLRVRALPPGEAAGGARLLHGDPASLALVHLRPVLADRDGLSVGPELDGVLLVADRRDPGVEAAVTDARRAVERRGGRLLGTVLVAADSLLERLATVPEPR